VDSNPDNEQNLNTFFWATSNSYRHYLYTGFRKKKKNKHTNQ